MISALIIIFLSFTILDIISTRLICNRYESRLTCFLLNKLGGFYYTVFHLLFSISVSIMAYLSYSVIAMIVLDCLYCLLLYCNANIWYCNKIIDKDKS